MRQGKFFMFTDIFGREVAVEQAQVAAGLAIDGLPIPQAVKVVRAAKKVVEDHVANPYPSDSIQDLTLAVGVSVEQADELSS